NGRNGRLRKSADSLTTNSPRSVAYPLHPCHAGSCYSEPQGTPHRTPPTFFDLHIIPLRFFAFCLLTFDLHITFLPPRRTASPPPADTRRAGHRPAAQHLAAPHPASGPG